MREVLYFMDNFQVQREWHYTIVENHVLKANLSSKAKLVYVILCMYSSKDKTCYPGLKSLCNDTGIKSINTIKEALDELKQNGYLEIKPRYDENGAQTSNLYIIKDYPPPKIDMSPHQNLIGGLSNNDIPPYQKLIAPLSTIDTELNISNNNQLTKENIYIVSQSKIKYAEFVEMTKEEYNKLVNSYGEENVKKMIEILDNYKGATGKKYKSDYRAILSWVADKVLKDKKGGNTRGSSTGDIRESAKTIQFNKAKFLYKQG